MNKSFYIIFLILIVTSCTIKPVDNYHGVVFLEEKQKSFWETIAPEEYGFWANVNPNVPHPRWSQKSEQQLGMDDKIPTIIYNGYGDYVASMYKKLEKNLQDNLFR